MQLVLSLFPGADLLGMAFEQEGFCVVRGPEILLGGDVKTFRCEPGMFDGVIGGPPCQAHSVASAGTSRAECLISEFERIVAEASPRWWVMENVPQAPVIDATVFDFVLDAHDYGAAQHRNRRFTSNLALRPVKATELHPDPYPCVIDEHRGVNGYGGKCGASRKIGRRMTMEEVNLAMGLPEDYETPALTVAMSYRVRGNGVPVQMGRAIARAVKDATHG